MEHLDISHVLGSDAAIVSMRVRDVCNGLEVLEVTLKRPQADGRRASYRRVNLLLVEESGELVLVGERLSPRLDLYLQSSGN